MLLSELAPRWIGFTQVFIGVSFLCPHCREQRLAVHFNPPIDPQGWWDKMVRPTYEGIRVWNRVSGDTFDSLTLNPSINASDASHWHGFIVNGEIR
jgi:hypothetical protein